MTIHSKFSKKDLEYLAKDVPLGTQTHVHHCKQGRGNDRLYIKVTDDGSILAYCHHCGKRGYSRKNVVRLREDVSHDNVANATREWTGASIYTGSQDLGKSTWGHEGLIWLAKYGISVSVANSYGIRWNDKYGLVIPINRDRELIGIQSRLFPSNPHGPKYLTNKRPECTRMDSDPLGKTYVMSYESYVFVEDFLSAVKISELCLKYSAIPLYGTKLHEPKRFRKCNIIIWLDNDNPQVKLAALRIQQELLQYSNNCGIIYSLSDPKKYTPEQISEALDLCHLCTK